MCHDISWINEIVSCRLVALVDLGQISLTVCYRAKFTETAVLNLDDADVPLIVGPEFI